MFTVQPAGADEFYFLDRNHAPEKQTLIRAVITDLDIMCSSAGLKLNIGIEPEGDYRDALNELTVDLESSWEARVRNDDDALYIPTHVVLPAHLITDYMQRLPAITALLSNAYRVKLKDGGWSYSLSVDIPAS